jgi:hypothetical protein
MASFRLFTNSDHNALFQPQVEITFLHTTREESFKSREIVEIFSIDMQVL